MKPPGTLPVLRAGDVLFTSFNFDAAEAAVEARRSGVWLALVVAGARPTPQDGWTPVADRFGSDDGEQMRLL